ADEVATSPGAIVVRGRIDAPRASVFSVRLVAPAQMFAANYIAFDAATDRFEAHIPFDPEAEEGGGERFGGWLASQQHAQSVRCLPTAGDIDNRDTICRPTMLHGFSTRMSVQLHDHQTEHWLRVANELRHQLPL